MAKGPWPNTRTTAAPMPSQLAQFMSRYYAIALWATAAMLIGYLILLPPQIDILQGLAWADLEAPQGRIPRDLWNFWWSRGFGYKVYFYYAEGLARLVAGDAIRIRICVFNTLYIALGLAMIGGGIAALAPRRQSDQASGPSWYDHSETLALGALLLLPATTGSWAQDTHLSNLLCFLGVCLALSPDRRPQWCSGFVLFLLFSVKGVTALNFLFVVAAVVAVGDNERIRRVLISAAVAGIAMAAAYVTVLHRELETLLLANKLALNYQGPHRFAQAALQFAERNIVVPAALLWLAVAFYRGVVAWSGAPRLFGFAVAVWLVPLASILTQGEFVPYHFQGFILSAWLSLAVVYLALGRQLQDFSRIRSAPAMTKLVVLFVCCIDLIGIAAPLISPIRSDYSVIGFERGLDCRIEVTTKLRALILSDYPTIAKTGGVLDLTPFYYGLELPSASRFFYPLPLRPQNIAAPEGREYIARIESYEGPVVITDHYLNERPEFAPIVRHLLADYRKTGIPGLCTDIDIWFHPA